MQFTAADMLIAKVTGSSVLYVLKRKQRRYPILDEDLEKKLKFTDSKYKNSIDQLYIDTYDIFGR